MTKHQKGRLSGCCEICHIRPTWFHDSSQVSKKIKIKYGTLRHIKRPKMTNYDMI